MQGTQSSNTNAESQKYYVKNKCGQFIPIENSLYTQA